ncbi:helix-turn-helix domain-containing protein [Paraburkholderia sp. ZP32-5]|uniref:helix-turn-helix domain-containing protein n=1 Tax=Paraburkholderia sp. ZP32-5 TaxID=2883245 RepID=UPI001F189452|nr:helix-turn-helix domain-containing protein [Paraburkholderia sp. ZP32-5]
MSDQLSRIVALRDVASQINSDNDLDALLPDLIKAACRHGSWDLGSVMAVDLAHGWSLVMARHDPTLLPRPLLDRWELATSPALVALQRGEPVYIRDARQSEEFPGYRRDANERDYCTVLIFPMTSVDANGRPMVVTVASRKVTDVSAETLAFMATIVHLGDIAVERAHRHRAELAAAEQLRRVLGAQSSMLREVLDGGSTGALTATLGNLLGAPVVVLDFFASSVVGGVSPLPELHDDASWHRMLDGAPGRQLLSDARDAIKYRHGSIALHPGAGASLDAQIEPLMVDDEAVGALLIFGKRDESDLRQLLIESAKFALSVQLMRSVIRFRFETRTFTELFFEIVERRWRDERDVLDRARRLGLSLAAPTRMLVIDFPDRTDGAVDVSVQAQHAISMLATQQHVAVHIVAVGGALVCLVPGEPNAQAEADREPMTRLAQRISDTLGRSFGKEPIVVLGDTCERLEDYARGWESCWRMIRIARTFGRRGVIAVSDLGPLPMLIGAADSADVRNFIDGAIGRVIAHDRKNDTAYLETLSAYIRSGCRGEPCAKAIGLHVTTLRYRLARISDLFGIAIETPEQRFAIELALQLHSLIDNGAPSARAPEPARIHRTGGE